MIGLFRKRAPAQARMPRRKARGALATIGGLLIASAVVRAAIGAEEALAREGSGLFENVAGAGQSTDHSNPSPRLASIGEADLLPVLEALTAREERIAKREAEIDRRMQALSLAESEVDRKLVALEDAEARLRATLSTARDAAESDIARLTDVYANMKPKQAAALFEEMDPEFAAGFIGRMRPNAAAAVMAGLSPTAAYTISVILAGRNANVPKE
ncbi:MotE family protein [Thetidibacter halocola]|uniref:Magnesium transporter MgtE intracellular domain-containing protein n=1 Tax=Thetidibacter halocola TaxID=2827239 RepID=A0A8J7WDQ8_9RHOB|nr:hypothetical protein [Thetidibacter halocola]MBS0125740.1 hypothetical protein [Thetidibacter halocola]